jgi:RNA polymerase sigma-70 factor (ECF subfamily)
MDQERVWLQGARAFDRQSLAEIYDQFSPAIYRYAYRLLGSADLAEECVAETFSRFLHTLKRGMGPETHLKAYLYRVAHNWVTDSFRRQPLPELPLDPELHLNPEAEPSHAVVVSMERERVRSALKLLTPDQRQVIALKFLEEMSNEEVAKVVEKPVGAVKALQHRGIQALRRMLLAEE